MGGQSKETKKRQDFRGGKKEVKKFYLRGDISNELPSKKDVLKLKDKDRKPGDNYTEALNDNHSTRSTQSIHRRKS